MFHGDKVLSYNGFLRFGVQSNGDKIFPGELLQRYPLVFLQGNQNVKLQYQPRKLSGSGRYEVHLREDHWINTERPSEPVSRELLMVGLQQVQQLLIRATEAADTTIAMLHGASLDVGRPDSAGSPRQAVGVELCTCPVQYGGTSCQDPGPGHYRFYRQGYRESVELVAWVGEAARCECSGRSDSCDPDTGACRDCREHTAGDKCHICAPGYYGEPDEPGGCRPCECPSLEHNRALTCYRSTGEGAGLVCGCQTGYAGPRCQRCAHGHYRSGEDCLPCACNPHGSRSEECEAVTGRCHCEPGVRGRACDQCAPRHILTSRRRCRNCDDGCVGSLLDTVERANDTLHTINLEDLDPAPTRKLTHYTNMSEVLLLDIERVQDQQQRAAALSEQEDAVGSEAELALLESTKLAKHASGLVKQAIDVHNTSQTSVEEIAKLDGEIKDMVVYLDNHGQKSGSSLSLNKALGQASDLLRQIRNQDFSQYDIKARTEVSNARIQLEIVEKLLFGELEVNMLQEKTDNLDRLVNDLLQYLTEGMSTVKEADEFNLRNNQSFARTFTKCNEIDEMIFNVNKKFSDGKNLIKDGDNLFKIAQDYFKKISDQYSALHSNAKKLEAREIGMSAVVEDYRTRFVLPCQANAEKLSNIAQKIKDLFNDKVGVDAEQAIKAANAYKKIIDGLDEARNGAFEAVDAAQEAYQVADPPGDKNLRKRAENLRLISEDLRQESQGLWKNAEDMVITLNSKKLDIDKYHFNIKENNKQIDILQSEMDRHSYVSAYAKEASEAASQALEESELTQEKTDSLLLRLDSDLQRRANDLNSFSAAELGSIPRKISQSQSTLQKVEKQAAYLDVRSTALNSIRSRVEASLAQLRSQVKMAKHAASSVKISIASDAEQQGACLRSYDVGLSPSTYNEISIIFGIESEERDSPLVFLPSSKKSEAGENDFLALEMVDRKIRFLWNTGAGTRSISHNVEIETAFNLARQDDMWYKITAERIGNIGRLNVRKVQPEYDLPEYHKWEVGESDHTANILDTQPQDRLWVGGAPNYYKSADLSATGSLSGVLYQLTVNKQNVGLWNFVSSFGCRETHSGVTDARQEHSCHTFSGAGYATQDQIRNYDPRYYAVSMEFRTFDSDALLVLVVNPDSGQYLAAELRAGRIVFRIVYSVGVQLEFTSRDTYNNGQWVKLEAGRALRGGQETGVLRVTYNGLREDFMDSIPPSRDLDLQNSKLYFGGVPPNLNLESYGDLEAKSLLGNMRGITTSNPGSNSVMNPLYTEFGQLNPHYGVIPSCENRILKTASFSGNGHLEVNSQPLRVNSSFGFTFHTKQADALVVLSTFLGKPAGDLADFYSVSLLNGRLALVFGSGSDLSRMTSFVTEFSYNDGIHHTLFVIKRAEKVSVYVDDVRVDSGEIKLSRNAIEMKAPKRGGLFIGGAPSVISPDILNSKLAASVDKFVGMIKDFAFIDDVSVRLVALNEPVSFFNVEIGREFSTTVV